MNDIIEFINHILKNPEEKYEYNNFHILDYDIKFNTEQYDTIVYSTTNINTPKEHKLWIQRKSSPYWCFLILQFSSKMSIFTVHYTVKTNDLKNKLVDKNYYNFINFGPPRTINAAKDQFEGAIDIIINNIGPETLENVIMDITRETVAKGKHFNRATQKKYNLKDL